MQEALRHEACSAYEKKHRALLQREHAALVLEMQQLEGRHEELRASLGKAEGGGAKGEGRGGGGEGSLTG